MSPYGQSYVKVVNVTKFLAYILRTLCLKFQRFRTDKFDLVFSDTESDNLYECFITFVKHHNHLHEIKLLLG